MPHRRFPLALLILPALGALLGLPSALRAADAPAEGVEFFEKKVRPILVRHCYSCHSAQAKKLRGGLRLDSREALLAGGDNGAGLVPGRPDQSRLIEAIGYKNVELQMPPRGKLPDAAIADLTEWVNKGAPWPRQQTINPSSTVNGAFDLQHRKRDHWAWQPIRPPSAPMVRNASWPRDPADRFILARLEDKGLSPAPAADRRTLLRRLHFDLIGLPPTPEEVEAFLARFLGRRRREGRRSPARFGALRRALGPALARPGALRRDRAATSSTTRSPTPTSIAITSSGRSTPTCRTTSSFTNTLPAICCRSRACIPRRVSTNRSSAPASGSSARRCIRQWTSARTRPTASTTRSMCCPRRSSV